MLWLDILRLRGFAEVAGTLAEVLENPLREVSRPLYLDQEGNEVPEIRDWEWPTAGFRSGELEKRRAFFAAENIVVIGNYEFIRTAGFLPHWLNLEHTRLETKRLITARKWWEPLNALHHRQKDNGSDVLIGQTAITSFFAHSPPVFRKSVLERQKKEKSRSLKQKARKAIEMRLNHPLRLRRAVELVADMEKALQWSFNYDDKVRARIERYTDLAPGTFKPEMIWEWIWFEPIHYVLNNLPAAFQVPTIMNNENLLQRFCNESGQGPGALFYILHGATGKFDVVQAAADVATAAMPGFPPLKVTTAKPGDAMSMRARDKVFQMRTTLENMSTVERPYVLGWPGPPIHLDWLRGRHANV